MEHITRILFRYNVGETVFARTFGDHLHKGTVLERRFVEDERGMRVEYVTDHLCDGTTFTQEELDAYQLDEMVVDTHG